MENAQNRGDTQQLFIEAVAEHLSADLSRRMALASLSLVGDDTYADPEIARAGALVAGATTLRAQDALLQLSSLVLTEVVIGADSLNLSPADARRHPLVREWIKDCLTEAVADAILAGRLGFSLCAMAPAFRCFEVAETDDGIVFARARMTFASAHGPVDVTQVYGTENGQIGFGRISVIGGDGVYAVGVALRGAALDAAPEQIDEGRASATAQVLSSVH